MIYKTFPEFDELELINDDHDLRQLQNDQNKIGTTDYGDGSSHDESRTTTSLKTKETRASIKNLREPQQQHPRKSKNSKTDLVAITHRSATTPAQKIQTPSHNTTDEGQEAPYVMTLRARSCGARDTFRNLVLQNVCLQLCKNCDT